MSSPPPRNAPEVPRTPPSGASIHHLRPAAGVCGPCGCASGRVRQLLVTVADPLVQVPQPTPLGSVVVACGATVAFMMDCPPTERSTATCEGRCGCTFVPKAGWMVTCIVYCPGRQSSLSEEPWHATASQATLGSGQIWRSCSDVVLEVQVPVVVPLTGGSGICSVHCCETPSTSTDSV